MTGIALILAATLGAPPQVEPVLWMHPTKGKILINGKPGPVRLSPGAATIKTPYGLGLDVGGQKGGLLIRDLDPLAITGSMTISTWLYLRDYAKPGSNAQILFRGDDRNGNDPYELCVRDDNTVQFDIGKDDGQGVSVNGTVPLREWVHITAAFSAEKKELRLWIGDRLMSTKPTDRRPVEELDVHFAPGVGIGNVQNDKGPHNQPLNGIIADLRLYSAALGPVEAGWVAPIQKQG